jgi:hypothetical protein
MAIPPPLKLAVRVVVFLLVMGLAFGAAIFGVPTGYYGWMQFQCWRAGPDSDACWWFDLLKYPDKPREGPGRGRISHRGQRAGLIETVCLLVNLRRRLRSPGR